ncbi:MAG: T9SS C-terminal target domain-containing protein [Cytophagales bacterium]|nr:MAG: T9SS C-terminal target domain-containing protein [Cytophagales bacterium]TAF59767.1 MAG: T9SS C-terminal target domain-containing protein [Cytophagales bacterium]
MNKASGFFLGVCLLCLTLTAQAQSADSLRMVDFYTKSNGSSWIKKKNWLSSDSAYKKWFGLKVNAANRVTSIVLPQNNLTGQISPEIKDCTELRTLNLAQNGLGGDIRWQIFNPPNIERIKLDSNFFTGSVPAQVLTAYNLRALYLSVNSLNSIPAAVASMPYLDTLDLTNNFFTFDDIRYLLGGGINVLRYVPQRRVGDLLNVTVIKSQTYSLDAIVTDMGSTYQWFKDGVAIAGATSRVYTIIDAKFSDAGTYYCNIKNPDVPALTLQRNNINITIDNSVDRTKDSLALVLFYNSTNGSKWTNKNNWLTGRLNTWYGITMSPENRVIALELPNNNLEGVITSAISQVEMLETINLSQNKLYGELPDNIRDLPRLKTLVLSQNQLTGGLPNLSPLLQLITLDLSNNKFSGGLPSGFGSLDNLSILLLGGNSFTDVNSAGLTGMAALSRLDLAANALTSLPKLKTITTLTQLSVQSNKLLFDDIYPNLGITSFSYSPQAKLDNSELVFAVENAALEFKVSLDSPLYKYQWFRNDKILPDQTSPKLLISMAKEKDEGSYHVAISDSLVPGLVLERLPIRLFVTSPSERRQDSLALVALYNNTNGASWKRNDNWLSSEPLSAWFGVTLSNGRVGKVQLGNNNLRGSLPNELGNLSGCETFDMGRNVLSGFIPATMGNMSFLKNLLLNDTRDPDAPNNETLGLRGEVPYALNQLKNLSVLDISANRLTSQLDLRELDFIQEIKANDNDFDVLNLHPNPQALKVLDLRQNNLANLPKLSGIPTMQALLVDGNRLTFEDLEYNVGIPIFTYAQQAKVGLREVVLVKPGQPYSFSAATGGTANIYKWQKNGNPLAGRVGVTLGSSAAERSEQGTYECVITNSIATNAALITEVKILFVVTAEDIRKDSLALVSLFNATNGSSWGVRWNWLGGGKPITIWEGVKTNLAGRVTSITLPNNSLNGTIPPEVRDLEALEILNFNGSEKLVLNSALTELKLLRELKLRNSRIDSLVNFKLNEGLKVLDLGGNSLEFNDLEPLQSLSFMTYEKQDSVGTAFNIRPELGKTYRLFMHTRGEDLSFRWLKNGVPIPDRLDSAFNLTFRAEADTGIYVCEASSPYFPKLKLFSRAFYISSWAVVSGMDNNALSEAITLYPNPSQSQQKICLASDSQNLLSNEELALYSASGQFLQKLRLEVGGCVVLPQLSSGLYWLRVSTPKGLAIKKFLVE